MAWRLPWGGGSEPEPEPEERPSGDLTDDFDVNELLAATPAPSHRRTASGKPRYLDEAPEPPPASMEMKRKDYLAVDPAQLRRVRKRREAQQSFWARLRRGELGTSDVPGQASASNLLFRIGNAFLTPVRAMVENVSILIGAAMAIALVAGFGVALLRFVQWQFGVLM